MEEANHFKKLSRTPTFLKYRPEPFSTDCVKSLGQIYEDHEEVQVLFNALFLNLTHSEDHVDGTTSRTKATLRLR